ncbi:MAG TPA: hypothetical protein VK153_00425 [Candidatus Paceibacterota bacterium]|nr:hypothetical protein [Candidatus Paceibacterota bacterium]
MLNYIEHSVFEKEFQSFSGKYHCSKDLEHLKNLFDIHFHPENPRPMIGPGKIHRLKDCCTCVLWKVEMVVSGLRKNQCPRIWFGVQGDTIAFLCMGTHIDNHDDFYLTQVAETLISDIF